MWPARAWGTFTNSGGRHGFVAVVVVGVIVFEHVSIVIVG